MTPSKPRRLPPMATLTAAERAADQVRAEEIARQPHRPAARPGGLFHAVQFLFAKPDMARQSEQVFRRRVSWRPLASPADRIPPDVKD
ncbi:MAG: hypothetical protein KF842_01905 [Caulobacter sp.]|nr:hypothetical protein [Caulobacter sp.]